MLELLAAICLVKGGHDIILTAFDNFKREMNEIKRFETLMEYFVNPETFQVNKMTQKFPITLRLTCFFSGKPASLYLVSRK